MNYEKASFFSGATALISVFLSFILIGKHAKNWTSPVQQRNIVIIILMAPLFAVDSFVGILELDEGETVAHIIDTVKECYEAVVIHAFLMLMYDLCGLTSYIQKKKTGSKESLPDGEKMYDLCGLTSYMQKKKTGSKESLPDGVKGRELHVPFPLSLIYGHPHFDMVWLHRLRFWTLQFVVLRPILSIVDLVWVDLMPSDFSKAIGLMITIVLNISVTTAVFALIIFYHAFEVELGAHRPLAKFICIKGVVFFATWQGVVLKILAHFDILHEGHRFSIDELELAWQDLLVCVEMGFLFSPLNLYAFTHSSYGRSDTDQKKKTN
eukprot:CAMPEP_0195541250 /NCGR_PEP_ID=MMETSP0794_2-20130614/50988_1 /TAXON_ID=515487 /ORGANISM="Stephanopyxis turris, Strain CCMP 815" /LENGTH=322 /DNA_ID=CAMNT_0040675339 /DNA_START=133 /DNA_END=1102 /DNA_ORIENTATION=+